MWVRIAMGAGLFLLGFTLGRGFERLEKNAHSPQGTTRIRDALARQSAAEPATPAFEAPGNNTAG